MDDTRALAPRSLLCALVRRRGALIGVLTLGIATLLCVATLPWTLGLMESGAAPYRAQRLSARHLPPFWAPHDAEEKQRVRDSAVERLALAPHAEPPSESEIERAMVRPWLGTDALGRDLLARCLVGGAISLGVGAAAAAIAVAIGGLYGAIAGWAGGRVDSAMMRIVDILYSLPSILIVVLLSVAADALASYQAPAGGWSDRALGAFNVVTLLVAIGIVSWLTMARVVRGQVMSLKARPFIEAAQAIGASPARIFRRHLLPNLTDVLVVYATLTAPQAILQESFLSFLGIGVRAPTPSWGNLVAEGLSELNFVEPRWWLLLFPSLLLAATLISLTLVGEGLRHAMDPRAPGNGRS